ncbi:MAG: ShlB/FhaC/HecB family hemolysin secretion/activation protein [Pseudomonadota bacterium]
MSVLQTCSRALVTSLLLVCASVAAVAETPIPDLTDQYSEQLQLESIWVDTIVLEGNTQLAPEAVNEVLAGYAGRQLSYESLLAARDALTRLYVSAGYINSGVVISDQKVVEGRVIMTAIEGKLGQIRFSGNRWLNDEHLESVLRHGMDDTLSVTELEASLRNMQRRTMIHRVNAELVPSSIRGISDLDLVIEEGAPMRLSFDANNHRAPSVGEYQGVLAFSHQSVTGREDVLTAYYALGDGVDDASVTYNTPLTSGDLRAELYYRRGNSDIVESGFDQLDITSDIETWGLRFSKPVLRGENQEIVLGLGFENITAESTLLGEPFSFSPGESNGASEVSLLRASIEWVWGGDRDALSLYTAINTGIDVLDPSDARDISELSPAASANVPDNDFTNLVAQLNYVRQPPWGGARALLNLTWQYSDEPLLPTLKLAVGGVSTVRGYRENQLVRDRGVVARGELRIPLFQGSKTLGPWGFQLAPFVDYGRAENNPIDLPGFGRPGTDELASVGAGLLVTGYAPLALGVYYGEPLIESDVSGDSLQDHGWHVRAAFSWAFAGF